MLKQVSDNPEKNRDRLSLCLVIITALLVTLYLTSNVMATKIIQVGDISLFDAGTITFPLTYMLGDILTELWGFKTAKRVIWLTFLCNTLFMGFTALGVILPYPEYMQESANAYATVFGYVPRIVLASLVAFLVGELTNSWVLVKIKEVTGGRYMWARTIGSSAVGHFLDTVIFVIIAFYGTSPMSDLISMIVIQYIAKLLLEAVGGTPLAYGTIAFIKRCI